ncbi:hypothetical protein MVEN_00717500 [Mycena venus]|uniref:P-loop containing nucleoside triphosphate hydrolase protein n=1 Tax=Mycena venus TaxID=2733690 RepID=A0A8H6YKF4_9AGAR|nr:hypothetical protein MVEN_00717500 [Mycena venus]
MSLPSKSTMELKTRTVPMRVLVLGFCRTGTSSIREALRMLGYNDTHHMDSVFRDPSQIDLWTAAIDAKFFGKGKALREGGVGFLARGLSDLPSILFAEDLVDAYPEAKVILTLRDPDAWYNSYDNTIGSMLRSRTSYIAAALNPSFYGKGFYFGRTCSAALLGKDGALKDVAKARFVEHYDRVRSLVPPERLLEYRVGEGWLRLCEFLGDDMPAEDFPNTNDTKTIREKEADAVRAVYLGVAKFILLALFLGMGIYWQTCR